MLEINKIYNEDCLNGMQKISNKSIDCIICDLPYGVLKTLPNGNGAWDNIIPFDKLWEQYNRIIKDDGVIVLFGNEPFSSYLRMSNIENYKYDIKWDKKEGGNPFLANKQPLRQYEDIIIFYKDCGKYNPQKSKRSTPIKVGSLKKSKYQKDDSNLIKLKSKSYSDKQPTNIITFDKIKNGAIHPTQKPSDLIEYLIKTYSNINDLILDNCMGSGTTAIACLNTNRNYIGFELDKYYYDIATKRIKDRISQPTFFDTIIVEESPKIQPTLFD